METTNVNTSTTNNGTAQQKGKGNEIKDFVIKCENPIKLNSPIKTYIETTNHIGTEILKKLTPVFGDLIGAFITVGNRSEIEIALRFEKLGANNVIDLFKSDDFGERISAFNTLNTTNRVYDLSDVVKGAFQRFLIKPQGNNKIDWNQYIRQITTNNNNMGGKHIVIELAHISLDKLLPELLFVGEDIKSRNEYQFNTTMGNLTNPSSPLCKNWFMTIQLLDQTTLDFVKKEAGITTSTYGLDMITL